MKRIVLGLVAIAFLLGVGLAPAQSLGDTARAVRKAKSHQSTTTKYYDNDNLPRNQQINVVGPQSSTDTKTTANSASGDKSVTDAASESQNAKKESDTVSGNNTKPASTSGSGAKSDEAMKGSIEAQKQKIESLSKDLDLTQREYRLRAAAMYSDVGNRLRNAAEWDKQDADYKKQIADKQQALDAAQQQLKDLEDQARTGEAFSDSK